MVKGIVVIHKDETRAGTFLIAKGFNREHKRILFFIEKYRDRFESFGHIPARKISTKGRPIEELLLNEDQTMFLGTLLKNTDTVLDFKQKIVKAFSDIKKKLEALESQKVSPIYKITREAGKILRLEATDIMKEFVEYAREQGSKSPEKYYMLFTKMVNGLLFIVEGKFKNLREVMTTQQLMTTATAESVVIKGISEGMKNKVFYKDVYKDVKSRVIAFANLTGQTKVIEEFLQLK